MGKKLLYTIKSKIKAKKSIFREKYVPLSQTIHIPIVMNKIFKVFFLSLIVSVSTCMFAQETSVQPTTLIEEVEYEIYEVQKSEGWYRISKKFNISQAELKQANPDKAGGLKLGDKLRIPIKPTPKAPVATPQDNYIRHKIQPKETLYGLSKRYGVSIDDIVKLNPETSKRMAIGTELIIPVVAPTSATVTTENTTAPQKVEAQETLASDEKSTNQPLPQQNTANTEVIPTIPSLETTAQDSLQMIPGELPIRIAFLLPFMLDAPTKDASADKFIEFYEGALLAIEDAKKQGVNIEVHAFDIEKNDIKIQVVLNRPEMKLMDAIIGPAYPIQVEHASTFAFDNKINTFIPFTSEVPALQINPYLYQFNTPVEYEAASISRAVLAVKSSPTVIMLNTPEATTDNCLQLKDSFKSKNIKVKEITVTAENKDSLVNYFQAKGNYLVFFNNDRYKHISQYIDVLNRVNNMNIELIGAYNWLGHKEEIHLPFYYASLFVPDSKRWKQKEYTRSFDRYFGHPLSTDFPRYDMLGYDITSMVLNGLNQYGPGGLQQEMPNYRYNGVQSSIQFVRKNPMGGCTNSVLTVLRYANGRTTEIEVK